MTEEFIDSKIVLCRKVHETTPPERILVSLSSGDTIFEDRIKAQPHFWKRLREYIHTTENKITGMRYQHFNGIHTFPSNAPYYYYIRRTFGNLGEGMMDVFRVGYSLDAKTIVGVEIGYGRIIQFEEDFGRGGFGVISNE